MFGTKNRLVGLDIGSKAIKAAEIIENKKGFALARFGMVEMPPGLIEDGAIKDPEAVAELIRGLFKTYGIKNRSVAVSVGGYSVIVKKISVQSATEAQLQDTIHFEAEQYIPFDINDVHIDFQILNPDDRDPSKMSVLLAASKKDIVNDYVAVFNEAGLKLMVMDVDAFAVQNAFELNYEVDQEEVSALINIGASIMNINIVKGGLSLFTRDVQMGGNLYTEEIQKQFSIRSDNAERIKLTRDTTDPDRLQSCLARVNETLSMEIRRSLDFYNSTATDGKIDKVFLSGGCAKIPLLTDSIGERLGLPVEIINPFQKVICNDKEFDPEYLQEMGPIVTVAVGLAIRRLGDK